MTHLKTMMQSRTLEQIGKLSAFNAFSVNSLSFFFCALQMLDQPQQRWLGFIRQAEKSIHCTIRLQLDNTQLLCAVVHQLVGHKI